MNQETRGLRIAFLAPCDPKDKAALSTCMYYMGQTLEKHYEVYYCEPIISLEKRFGRLIDAVSRRLFKKNVAYDHLLLVAKKHGKLAAQRLDRRPFDAIVAIMNPVDIAFLETDIPVALVLDATFALQHNYHPQFSNLWEWSAQQANKVEEMAYQNATVLLYSSYWAARSAIKDYAVDPQKVHTIFFGANLDTIPSREVVLAKKKSERCRLLFMGLGWERKGGAIAFETLLELEKLGIQAELIVCGCTPPKGVAHERMMVIPFLDKNDERQSKEIAKLYILSDFLLLPTRVDCTPHVINEANAFGVPVITTDTGGVSDIIRSGENGYLLSYSARGSKYAQIIAEIYQDDQRYTALVESSRAVFESRLNWDVWGSDVKQVLQNIIDRTPLNRKVGGENLREIVQETGG
jgi:glycosyltransferase involved in cell wall biosynthesis